MSLSSAWAVPIILAGCVATLTSITGDAEAKDEHEALPAVRSEASLSAGGVPPTGGALANPYQNDGQRAQTGAWLFSAMNCDGCHGAGALGSAGPSLVDGRWRYGGAEDEIFHSIFSGRLKGMPAYGGVLGSDGIWMIVTYLQSQPMPTVVPTTSYEDRATTATPAANGPPSAVTVQPAGPAGGVERRLTMYGCVACHSAEQHIIGPAYHDIAAKYRTQADAVTYLVTQVKQGSVGVWGRVPMPAHFDVPDGDLSAIMAWILTSQ